jgi:transposase
VGSGCILREMGDAETWSKRVAEWRASGLTAREFCAEHELKLSALRYWTYRQRAAAKGCESSPVKLVPVTVEPTAETTAPSPREAERAHPALTLEVGQARVVVPPGFDRQTLRALLDVLGVRPPGGAR